MSDRDIRLSSTQIMRLADACRRRRRQIEKQLERSSYDTQPYARMKLEANLDDLRELEVIMEHNRKAIAQGFADRVRGGGS